MKNTLENIIMLENNDQGVISEENTITPDSVLKDTITKSRHFICEENARRKELADKILVSKRLIKPDRELAYAFICGEKPPLVKRGPKKSENEDSTITPDSVIKDTITKSRHFICEGNAKRKELADKILVSKRLKKTDRELAYSFICGEKPPLVKKGPKKREDDYLCLAMEFLDMKSGGGMRIQTIKNRNVILKKFGFREKRENANLIDEKPGLSIKYQYINHISFRFGLNRNVRKIDELLKRYELSNADENIEFAKKKLGLSEAKLELIELRGIKSYLGEKYKLPGGEDVANKSFYEAVNKGIDKLIDSYSTTNTIEEPVGFSKIMRSYVKQAIKWRDKNLKKTFKP